MAKAEKAIVGLDIGTTKVCAIVGEINEDEIEITGFGSHPASGMRKGVIVNIENTVRAITRAVEEAELTAGSPIKSVFVGVAGNHIFGVNSHGVVAVKERVEIKEDDLRRCFDAARAMAIPQDRAVIHIMPQEYAVDDQRGIMEPMGMSGVRLEAKVHIVTGAASSLQNIYKCVERAGLGVQEVVLEQLASSEAVLDDDEKELGVALIDIGGGTSDLAIFTNGSLKHSYVLGLGGDHLTNDIAIGLRTPPVEAEKIKKRFGCAMSAMVCEDETIEVPSVGDRRARSLSRQTLC